MGKGLKGLKFFSLVCLVLLVAGGGYAAETARWSKTFNEDATATSYTSHFDADGDGYETGCDGVGVETVPTTCASEVRPYKKWIVYNGDSADTLYCDGNSTSDTQNTAVNDGSKSTSIPIPAGASYTFINQAPRSTISCICASGQTCSNVILLAVEPL